MGVNTLSQAYCARTFQGLSSPGTCLKRVDKWIDSPDSRDKACKFAAAVLTVALDCLSSALWITCFKELLVGVKALRNGNSLFNGPAKVQKLWSNVYKIYEIEIRGDHDYGDRSPAERKAYRLQILAGTISLAAFMVMFVGFRPIVVLKKYTSIPYFPMMTQKIALRGFMCAAAVNHLATVVQNRGVIWEARERHARLEGQPDATHNYCMTVAPAHAKVVEKTGDLARDAIFFSLLSANWYLASALLLGTASLSLWSTWAKTFDSRAAEAARAA